MVAGESLEARDEALGDLLAAVVAGGTLALLIASAIGYRVAGAALAPLTALSRRAGDVSLRCVPAGFPLPAARDEVRRLGEALNDMLARLRRTSDRERAFVADAAGGMHMPIAVGMAELEGALRAGDCPPPVREALEAALAEFRRLTRFADDVLLAARSGEDALPPRSFTLDAVALLAGVRDDHAERARRAGRQSSSTRPPARWWRAIPSACGRPSGPSSSTSCSTATGTSACVPARAARASSWPWRTTSRMSRRAPRAVQ